MHIFNYIKTAQLHVIVHLNINAPNTVELLAAAGLYVQRITTTIWNSHSVVCRPRSSAGAASVRLAEIMKEIFEDKYIIQTNQEVKVAWTVFLKIIFAC